MSERILQAVEEVKEATKEVQETSKACVEADNLLRSTGKACSLAKEKLKEAERKLKGVIFEETQINE